MSFCVLSNLIPAFTALHDFDLCASQDCAYTQSATFMKVRLTAVPFSLFLEKDFTTALVPK